MRRHRMTAVDAAWLRMDSPENLMVVTSVMWLDRPLARPTLVALLRERVISRFPRFSQRVLEESGLWWEDVEDFDVEAHIHEYALPEPSGRAELERFVGEQVSVPLRWDRPLWDLHVIDRFEDGAAVVFRMHHAIADGFSLVRVLLSLTDDPSAESVEITAATEDTGLLAGAWQDAVSLASSPRQLLALADPRRLIEKTSGLVSGAAALTKLLTMPADQQTVLKGPLGGRKQTVWTEPLSFDEVKKTAQRHGVTINDLLLAAVAGSLRHYLVRRRHPVAEVRAVVPFNLRPLDKPLGAELGNRFGLVYLQLPMLEPTRGDRLRTMNRRMESIKRSAEGVVAFGILETVGRLPRAAERVTIKLFSTKGTAVMTNVPGPRKPVTLAGANVLGCLGWGPTSGDLALGVAIFSYAGTITVGFCADESVIPDPQILRADFVDELESLLKDEPAVEDGA